MNHNAIFALYPQVVTVRGEDAFDENNNLVQYDKVLVETWVDPNEYKTKRLNEYPSIGEQLDALFHAGVFPSDMAAQIQAIKDKYPKV
jgi:hypothetical protein